MTTMQNAWWFVTPVREIRVLIRDYDPGRVMLGRAALKNKPSNPRWMMTTNPRWMITTYDERFPTSPVRKWEVNTHSNPTAIEHSIERALGLPIGCAHAPFADWIADETGLLQSLMVRSPVSGAEWILAVVEREGAGSQRWIVPGLKALLPLSDAKRRSERLVFGSNAPAVLNSIHINMPRPVASAAGAAGRAPSRSDVIIDRSLLSAAMIALDEIDVDS